MGVFGSPSSNEHLLAAEHFGLSRADLVRLSERAVESVFAGPRERDRMLRLLADFSRAELGGGKG